MSSGFSTRTLTSATHPSPPRKPVKVENGSGLLRRLLRMPVTVIVWLMGEQRRLGWKRFFLRILFAIVVLFALYILFLILTLPRIDERTILSAAQSTVITDRNGVELYRVFGEQDRTIVAGTEIADAVKKAMIAIEDKRYYDRGCIDVRALARAVVSLGRAGGASTITRQLARNALDLKRENILSRKIKEFILGCQLERRYDKNKLLDLYLNWIPFGQNAYGVEQASRRYFGKAAKELTVAESAVLGSLPQLPSYFSPYGRHVRTVVDESVRAGIATRTIVSADDIDDDDVTIGLLGATVGSGTNALYVGGRADQVLRSMQDAGFITEEQRTEATEDLQVMTFKAVRENIRAPHFVLWAKEQVERLLEESAGQVVLEQGGLTIQTTLDWRLQEAAEEVIAHYRETAQKVYGAHNIALVALDPVTREILAYVGNVDYGDDAREGKIDMALAPRQPGSSFKPFVYAAAFQNGYGPATVLYDVPTKFGDYEPQNFEGAFWGLMSARRALGASRNIPAVKAYFLGGQEDRILALAETLGVPTPKRLKPAAGYGAALAIGAAEAPLLEMTQGFSTFAAGGTALPATGIIKVTDLRGSLLPLPDTASEERVGSAVLDPRIAYEVTSILSDVNARPNDFWKSILSVPGFQAAAKTGTSNKCLERDAKQNCKERKPDNVWTIGYTPALVAGVWAGNATSDPLSDKADGLTVAAPIWHDFMVRAHKLLKPSVSSFAAPEGIVQAQISQLSGELPTECTPVPLRRSDIFLSENAPTKDDPACVTLGVDKVTGLLASESCPVEAREDRSFLVPYNAAGKDFPQWDTDVLKWAGVQAKENPSAGSGLILFAAGSGGVLPLPLAPIETCDIALTPGRTIKPTVEILSPADGGSANYPSFQPTVSYTVGSRVRQMDFAIDSKLAASIVTAPFTAVLRVPRSIEQSGSHRLTVTVTDQYYNTASDEVTFFFQQDRSGPSIRVTEPQEGATLPAGSPLVMRAESDDSGGVKYVEFFLDNLLLTRKPVSPYELIYTAKVDPGEHTVKAVATDLAGNTAEDEVNIMVK